MNTTADNPTLDPQFAADAAAMKAAEGAPFIRPDYWMCASPPWGCGQLKPSSEFSFEERKGDPRGGGKDLCHDCKKSAPKRYRQRKTKAEIETILERMGRSKEGDLPITMAKLASAGVRAFGGEDELFAGIMFDVEQLEELGKYTSAGNMRLGVAKILSKAAEQLEAVKPVEQMNDDELLRHRQQLNQVIVNNVHNYYIQQHQAGEPLPVTLEQPVLDHAPANAVDG